MQIETVKTDHFSMDYFQFGHGKETLVILPGLSVQSVMNSADDIAGAYQLLTDDFTIYVFDRRKDLPATYSIHEMAQDTAEAFRALGLHHTSLFGASQGGMIAMSMAIEQLDLAQKLVLCSTTACMTEVQYQTIEKWIQLAKAGDAADLYLAFGEALYPPNVFKQSRELLTEIAKSVTDEDLGRFVTLAKGMKNFDVTDNLKKITCPVFVIGSKDDRVLGSSATEQISERLRTHGGFALHMYEGYGHAAFDTAPDFKERMLRFLVQEPATTS